MIAHKTAVRELLLALPSHHGITTKDLYVLCRKIPNRPRNWKDNERDELRRLKNRGYFTHQKGVWTRTTKPAPEIWVEEDEDDI